MMCYNELKAEMKQSEQQVIETKMCQGADTLNEFQRPRKELAFTSDMLKDVVAKGRKSKILK